MRRWAVRQVLIAMLSGERFWAFVVGTLLVAGMAPLPLTLFGVLSPLAALLIIWPIAIASAFAAHAYRGRAMLWETMCRKAQREGAELFESLLQEHRRVVEGAISPDDTERMLN